LRTGLFLDIYYMD